jgi:hypothetical protein
MDSTDIAAPRILKNVGGVPGAHILLNAFSEEIERLLFTSSRFFNKDFNTEVMAGHERALWHRDARTWGAAFPAEVYKLTNLIIDSGLYPGLVYPDMLLDITYRSNKDRDKGPNLPNKGPKFALHFDSKYTWGETVIGVSLGAASCLRFFPAKGQTINGPAFAAKGEFGKGLGASRVKDKHVEIELPRRSIYIMSGPSRTDWRHAISPIEDKSPPSQNWNPGFRRSLTMRTVKWYSDAVLQNRLRKAQTNEDFPAAAALVERIDAQNVFKKGVTKKGMQRYYPGGKEQAQQFAQEIESGELTRLRFTDRELRGGGEFQGAGQHLGGASGTSTRAPSRKRSLNQAEIREVREARIRRLEPTAPAIESQEVIVIDD